MKFWWKRKSHFSIRKELNPKERNLLFRLRRTLGRGHLPDRAILLYFIEDKEELWGMWPVLKAVDEHYPEGSELFKKLIDRRKEKLHKYLSDSIQPDKRFPSNRAAQ